MISTQRIEEIWREQSKDLDHALEINPYGVNTVTPSALLAMYQAVKEASAAERDRFLADESIERAANAYYQNSLNDDPYNESYSIGGMEAAFKAAIGGEK